jgi:signal recognition particle subunit SRP54
MFDELSRKLEAVFKKLRGQGKITEANVAESLREVRRALLDADVNYKVAKQFVEDVQRRAVGQEVLTSITPGQLVIKIIHEEMIRLLGGSKAEISFAPLPPTVILLAGLQGSGKTTLAAKLAKHLKGKGHYPMLVAADIYRPAAVDQLRILASQIQIPVHTESGRSAVELSVEAVDHARRSARDVVIIDTAGRLHIDEEMMREVEAIRGKTSPHEILFVVDAMTGQDAVNTAKAFHDRLDFSGVILTKLDGDTRGGAALSIRAVVSKPIKFVSVGEKLDALEPFHPDRMASRILGMGDVVSLVEKVQEQYDEAKAIELEKKIRKAEFSLNEFLDQLQQLKKMGPLQEVMAMIPGMQRALPSENIDEKALVRVEAIIQSMTPHERAKPHIINGSRRKRIARGSGSTVQEVNKLLKQFGEMHRMMKNLSKRNVARMFKGFPSYQSN